ncbi:hypothetical protein DPMN_135982 [Dreissena polymorpha]|uniref:Uncharacterized protein n=1 Tax=Dreissena polymorpha TaxID=45954 RepID=A0A9D4JDD5_DREPO|nr:hypothetical protein DPMN_135982 [Dreissena polymorpha]
MENSKIECEEIIDRIDEWILKAMPRNETAASETSRRSDIQLRVSLAEHKLSILKQRQEIEKQQRDLEMQLKRLELEAEAEEARLELSVLSGSEGRNQLDRDSVRSESRRVPEQAPLEVPTDRHLLQPTKSSNSDLNEGLKLMAATINEGFNLPKPNILSFSGNPADYCLSLFVVLRPILNNELLMTG